MGPLITTESKQPIESLIRKGVNEGAKVLVDGRNPSISGYKPSYFVHPTVLDLPMLLISGEHSNWKGCRVSRVPRPQTAAFAIV
jgi:hypothetical protein